MSNENTRTDVAVFIDFENVYVSVREKLDASPNFESIMDRCNDLGRVVISRAYADWYRYPRITSALYANSIEPIYVPTYYYDKEMGRTGRAIKNSVDMNLCIDVMKALFIHNNIAKFVLATGDRDFIPLVNSIRQQGKEVIIIGIGGAASTHLAQSADEFIFYEQLVGKVTVHTATQAKAKANRNEVNVGIALPPVESSPDPGPDVYDILVQAIHVVRERGYLSTLGSLKLVMKELMGGEFKESHYKDLNGRQFNKFKDFVLDAEKRGKVQIYTNGTVSEVFLPGEDASKLSQFAELKELSAGTEPEPVSHSREKEEHSSSSRPRRRRKPRNQRQESRTTHEKTPTIEFVEPKHKHSSISSKEKPAAYTHEEIPETSLPPEPYIPELLSLDATAGEAFFSMERSELEKRDDTSDIMKEFESFAKSKAEEEIPFLFEAERDEVKDRQKREFPVFDYEHEHAELFNVGEAITLSQMIDRLKTPDTVSTEAFEESESDDDDSSSDIGKTFGETFVAELLAESDAKRESLAETEAESFVPDDHSLVTDSDDGEPLVVESSLSPDEESWSSDDSETLVPDELPISEDDEESVWDDDEDEDDEEEDEDSSWDDEDEDEDDEDSSWDDEDEEDEEEDDSSWDDEEEEEDEEEDDSSWDDEDEEEDEEEDDSSWDDEEEHLSDPDDEDGEDESLEADETDDVAVELIDDFDSIQTDVAETPEGLREEAIFLEEVDCETIQVIFSEDEWQRFRNMMQKFSKPISFAQIFNSLRDLRKDQVINRTNEQLRSLVKQAINHGLLERIGRGKRVYYVLKQEEAT